MRKKTIFFLILGLSIFIFSAGVIHLLAALNPCEREPQVASCNDFFIGSCTLGGGCSWNRSFVAVDCKITCRNYYLDGNGNCVPESIPDQVSCGEMAH